MLTGLVILIVYGVVLTALHLWTTNETIKQDTEPLSDEEDQKWRDFLRKGWWE